MKFLVILLTSSVIATTSSKNGPDLTLQLIKQMANRGATRINNNDTGDLNLPLFEINNLPHPQ